MKSVIGINQSAATIKMNAPRCVLYYDLPSAASPVLTLGPHLKTDWEERSLIGNGYGWQSSAEGSNLFGPSGEI